MELISERGRIDLYDDFTWSLNYKTSDVINLTGRKTSFTKTIVVPYTSRNANIFQGLNQPNADNIGFDTRETLNCFLTHSGRILMQGQLSVISWSKTKEEEQIELQLIQRTKELVGAIKGVSLKDLDFSHLNHDLTLENVLLTYDGFNIVNGSVQPKNGYVYPLIDYGKDDTFPVRWTLRDLRPCLYLKEIIDVIFLEAGKTYSSNFFDSPYFQSLVLINTLKNIFYTQEQKNPFKTSVENSVEQYTEQQNDIFNQNVEIFYPVDTDTEILDPLNQWDVSVPSSSTWTIQKTGKYKFTFKTKLTHEYALSIVWILNNIVGYSGAEYVNQGNVTNYFILRRNGIPFGNYAFDNTPLETYFEQYIDIWGNPPDPLIRTWYPQQPDVIVWTQEVELEEGDVMSFELLSDERVDSGLREELSLRWKMEDTLIQTELVEAVADIGDELNFENYIPNIKADEFIDTIFNTFNLWVIDDPYQNENMIIEPRTNFFQGGGSVDWSQKLDISREIKNNFLAEELPKVFKYRFENSPDRETKNFFESNDFGYADFDSEDFLSFNFDEQEIKTRLTPMISTETNGLVYPKIFGQTDDLSEKTDVGNVLKIGFVNNKNGYYQIDDETTVTDLNDYVVISEFDNVDSPTYSLTFGDAETTLNQSQPAFWNLFRLFHQLTEEEKTRKGAKVVELYCYLNENDISQLDLRRVVFINGVYYRIVSINNYNPLTSTPTKIELLQIDAVRFDFTSNEIIYKTNQGGFKLLSTNRNQLVTTNKNQNVPID